MISALTLCPALCAIMMHPSDGTSPYHPAMADEVHHPFLILAQHGIERSVVSCAYPDQGVIMVNVSISPGSTLEETTKVMDRLENILKDTPGRW